MYKLTKSKSKSRLKISNSNWETKYAKVINEGERVHIQMRIAAEPQTWERIIH